MSSSTSENLANQKQAFDYAWNYFSLHAGHRMQSVHFFLIATSFLATAHVAATVGKRTELAVGIAIVGALSSYIFFRIERRVRELLRAAEDALRPMERAVAVAMDNPDLRILEKVHTAGADAWPYSKVFRALYSIIGIAFGVAAAWGVFPYALHCIRVFDRDVLVRAFVGTILLTFSYGARAVAQSISGVELPNRFQRLTFSFSLALAAGAALAGIVVLFRLGIEA